MHVETTPSSQALTEDPSLTADYPFDEQGAGVGVFSVPLDDSGGLAAELIHVTSSETYELDASSTRVLEGTCDIEGEPFAEDWVAVAKSVDGERCKIAAAEGDECLAMAVSL